ncbi:MAG: hypothetical protein A2452_12510 [Candidatus Firestonebacteria bacterium RIFOXYC2_FULL_39_67]|nr:MAG: hypothetical protein A2536_03895 [Candidatus Firestonebacteria bacterium RIFOXYD2_FULL_39_29]OGF54118.1 MAG: hypothetical protein A2452_12510 [Candidatus Firestonebacteria bacterium RIFOXYC2_FULL_39_67]OGF54893.1 MAG: hypothetical protein A2497_08175 [Candidatus Firestonebacteria bacterium RifOxyC12_full_39_7]
MKSTISALFLTVLFLSNVFPLSTEGDSSDKLTKASELVKYLSVGKYSDSVKLFDETMKNALPADKLEETWKKIISQVGAFKERSAIRKEESGKYTIVYVTCKFENMDLDAKVVLDKENNVAGLFFVPSAKKSVYNLPSYAKPDNFVEIEVIVGSDEWKLPGTLTLPKGSVPFPAVILIHGSGPQDRDESIGPNKPFKDIAIGLASNGIAILRYEKRTKEYQQKMAKMNNSITLKEEVTDDVLAACELLRKTEKIDKNRIFLLGHSLGGLLIPRLGALDKNTAGLIIMAGNTRPFEDLLVDQTKYLFSLNNEMSETEKEAQMTVLIKQVEKIRQKDYIINTPGSELPLGIPPAYWQDLQKYNAGETAKSLRQPLLVLQGERDYQVTKLDFDGWKSNLKEKSNVNYKLYPKLNHLFMEGQGKCTPQEYFIESHVVDYVIKDIVKWIGSQKR